MSTTIAELLVEIGVDAKQAEQAAKRVEGELRGVAKAADSTSVSVGKAEKSFDRMAMASKGAASIASGLTKVLAAAGAAVGAIGTGVLQTGGNFERLTAQLKTATGSAEGAERALGFIRDFARNTPFQVEEITSAFVKLTNLGLDPSERALTAYGDTASAMGKSLDQFIEAAADAVTGEFERLKEFGIKAKSEGDRVQFTFRGMTTEVGKNAAEIEEFLIGLGEQNFAGGMAEQMETLGGIVSNFKDSFTDFLLTVANMGPLEEFKLLVTDLRDATAGQGGLAQSLARTLTSAIRGVRQLIKGDFVRVLELLAGTLELVITNIDKFAALLAGAKIAQAFGAAAAGFQAMGVAAGSALGPIGLVAGALAALIPIAMEAGDAIGEALAKRAGLAQGRTVPRGAPELLGSLDLSEETSAKLRVGNQLVSMREKSLRDAIASGDGSRISAAEDLLAEAQSSLEVDQRSARLESQQRKAREAEIPDVGPSLPPGGLGQLTAPETPKSKRRGRGGRKGAKSAAEKAITSPTTVSEFFTAAARGELGPIAARTPSTADIEPTVAVDITNNNFDFNIQQTIDGKASPVETAKEVAKAIKAEFETRLSVAGQQLASNVVR